MSQPPQLRGRCARIPPDRGGHSAAFFLSKIRERMQTPVDVVVII